MAYTYAYSGNGSPSAVTRSGGGAPDVEFLQSPGNSDYDAWLVHVAAGGATSAAPTISLATRKTTGKARLAVMAADAAAALTVATPRDPVYEALRYAEAQRYADLVLLGETPTAGEFILLESEVDSGRSADLADASADVLVEMGWVKNDLATIEAGRVAGDVAIDAATTQAEIDAAILAADLAPWYVAPALPGQYSRRSADLSQSERHSGRS